MENRPEMTLVQRVRLHVFCFVFPDVVSLKKLVVWSVILSSNFFSALALDTFWPSVIQDLPSFVTLFLFFSFLWMQYKECIIVDCYHVFNIVAGQWK